MTTDTAFPFEVAASDEPAGSGDKRKMLLVAGAGAVVVALLGYFVVLPMLGGSGSSSTPLTVVHHSKAKTKSPVKPAAAKKPVTQPQTYAEVAARTDPFKPLFVAPVVTDAGTTAGTAGGTTADTSGSTAGSTTSGSTSSGSATSVGGQRVALVHVFAKDGKWYAQTKVGDQVFTPAVGQVFGGSYKLLATSGKTATYLFGDEQFSLSEGQEVLK